MLANAMPVATPATDVGDLLSASGRQLLSRLACPACRAPLVTRPASLACDACRSDYPVVDGVIDLRPPAQRATADNAWWGHWSDVQQQRPSQRFFSAYRKAVFARTVRFFTSRYFAPHGVFVEAGCGTAESSMRIAKHDGARTLVGVDLVLPIVARCHPIIDVRCGGDILHLPFGDGTIDGIWNVGVMEHFSQAQIARVMREFYRVLRVDGVVVMLWPGVDSVPQRVLHAIEAMVNVRRRGETFRFHHIPDEVSQLRSLGQGREILTRHGFAPVHLDYGLRSLLAFKTLVGRKTPSRWATTP